MWALLAAAPPLVPRATTADQQNRHGGFRPSPPAERLASLIDGSKSIDHLLQIHASLLRHNLHRHRILNFKLQRSYSSLGRLHYSAVLFRATPNPTVFSWTSIIHAHAVRGLHHHAVDLYERMVTQGVDPNAFTFSSLLKSCPLHSGRCIHSHVIKLGLGRDTYVATALVDVYAKGGQPECARKVFDVMPEKSLVSLTAMITGFARNGGVDDARALFEGTAERDVVCWNGMIDGYARQGRAGEALALFRQMLGARVKPDVATITSALSACGQVGALESGRWLHSYVQNHRGAPASDVRVATALVDMYCKCGAVEEARSVFDGIRDKDVVSWNSMIGGCAMHGYRQEAVHLFDEMRGRGIRPNDVTFIGMLSACAHAGLVREGWGFFHSMVDEYGIQPRIEHHGCMVNLLARAGHLEEAYELVNSLGTNRSDPILWATLLWACRLHGSFDLGQAVSEVVVSMADSGAYTLLSSIYAADGEWERAASVRRLMRESGMEKEAGCSWIEVNNVVHQFLSGDLRHPKCREIYTRVGEMNGLMRDYDHFSYETPEPI